MWVIYRRNKQRVTVAITTYVPCLICGAVRMCREAGSSEQTRVCVGLSRISAGGISVGLRLPGVRYRAPRQVQTNVRARGCACTGVPSTVCARACGMEPRPCPACRSVSVRQSCAPRLNCMKSQTSQHVRPADPPVTLTSIQRVQKDKREEFGFANTYPRGEEGVRCPLRISHSRDCARPRARAT